MPDRGSASTLIQLTRLRTDVTLTPDALACLQRQFREEHCIRLPNLLAEDLLAIGAPRLENAQFNRMVHPGIKVDLKMSANSLLWGLRMAANDPVFLRAVQAITEAEPFSCFTGRVYRMSEAHSDGWHSDWTGDRRIGMSINLTPQAYTGGLFQIRQKSEDRVLHEIHNTGLGDAIVFRLSDSLVHRVTDVTGTVAKMAFAGWFRATGRFWEDLRVASV